MKSTDELFENLVDAVFNHIKDRLHPPTLAYYDYHEPTSYTKEFRDFLDSLKEEIAETIKQEIV